MSWSWIMTKHTANVSLISDFKMETVSYFATIAEDIHCPCPCCFTWHINRVSPCVPINLLISTWGYEPDELASMFLLFSAPFASDQLACCKSTTCRVRRVGLPCAKDIAHQHALNWSPWRNVPGILTTCLFGSSPGTICEGMGSVHIARFFPRARSIIS